MVQSAVCWACYWPGHTSPPLLEMQWTKLCTVCVCVCVHLWCVYMHVCMCMVCVFVCVCTRGSCCLTSRFAATVLFSVFLYCLEWSNPSMCVDAPPTPHSSPLPMRFCSSFGVHLYHHPLLFLPTQTGRGWSHAPRLSWWKPLCWLPHFGSRRCRN